jgi:hypothetical protein
VNGEGRDGHALEDPERVALEDAAVHERPGVAFVRVADDVLLSALGLGDGGPLEADGVAGAAAAAQAAAGDLVADFGGCHVGENALERLVAAAADVVVEAFGVDPAHVLGDDPELLLEERALRAARVGRLDLLEGLDDAFDVVRLDPLEELGRLGDLDQRTGGAESEAADALDRHVGHAGAAMRSPRRRVMSWDWADMQLAASHTYAEARGCPSAVSMVARRWVGRAAAGISLTWPPAGQRDRPRSPCP